MYAYVVRTTFEDAAARSTFAAWLRDRHMGDVRAAGAVAAELVVLDAGVLATEVRYLFASREDFLRYEAEEAPRLRADGLAELARMGLAPGNGAIFERWTGAVLVDQAAARAP